MRRKIPCCFEGLQGSFETCSLRCALTCISSDLPATRKVCGFEGHSATMGCSKCKVQFKSGSFGEKLDYSGYNRDSWKLRDRELHMEEVSAIPKAKTTTAMLQLKNNMVLSTLSYSAFHIFISKDKLHRIFIHC